MKSHSSLLVAPVWVPPVTSPSPPSPLPLLLPPAAGPTLPLLVPMCEECLQSPEWVGSSWGTATPALCCAARCSQAGSPSLPPSLRPAAYRGHMRGGDCGTPPCGPQRWAGVGGWGCEDHVHQGQSPSPLSFRMTPA